MEQVETVENVQEANLRLVIAGESLLGQQGIDTASLRKVAVLAGNGNNNAVKYHFGSREGLIEAIIRYRVRQLDIERVRMIAEAEAAGTIDDLHTLVRIYCLPHVALRAPDGRYPYANFLLQFYLHYKTVNFSVPIADLLEECPGIARVQNGIILATGLEGWVAENRMSLGLGLFLTALVRLQADEQAKADESRSNFLIHDAIAQFTALLRAPVPEFESVAMIDVACPSYVSPLIAPSEQLKIQNEELRQIICDLTLENFRLKQNRYGK